MHNLSTKQLKLATKQSTLKLTPEGFYTFETKHGNTVLLCAEGYKLFMVYKWYTCKAGPIVRNGAKNPNGKGYATVYFHRELLGCAPALEVDFIDRNQFNLQLSNLRQSTRTQNIVNVSSKKRVGARSQYKGVQPITAGKSWRAFIGYEGKKHILGPFTSEVAAAQAYDKAAKAFYGEYACLNFKEGK